MIETNFKKGAFLCRPVTLTNKSVEFVDQYLALARVLCAINVAKFIVVKPVAVKIISSKTQITNERTKNMNKTIMLPLLAGFVGGIGPSLTEFMKLCKAGTVPHPMFFVGALITGLMGLLVVLFAKETTLWKAFTQGISAPAIFNSVTTTASVIALSSPIPAVYAQDSVYDTTTIEQIVDNSINNKHDSVAVSIDGVFSKQAVGSKLILTKDSLSINYTVPDTDTVKINLNIEDPVIRRSIIQGFLPMQQDLTKKLNLEKHLVIETKQ